MLSLIPSGKWTAGNIAAVAADTAHQLDHKQQTGTNCKDQFPKDLSLTFNFNIQ